MMFGTASDIVTLLVHGTCIVMVCRLGPGMLGTLRVVETAMMGDAEIHELSERQEVCWIY